MTTTSVPSVSSSTPTVRVFPRPSSWIGSAECPICDRVFIPRSTHRVQQMYCSSRCANRASEIRIRLEGAWAGPVHLRCGFCSEPLVDPHPNRRFCSTLCQHRAWQRLQYAKYRPERLCEGCGQPLPETGPTGRARKKDAKVCGYDCELLRRKRAPEFPASINAARREKRRLAKLNGANGHAANGHDDATATNRSAADARPDDTCSQRGNPGDHHAAQAHPPGIPRDDAARTAT